MSRYLSFFFAAALFSVLAAPHVRAQGEAGEGTNACIAAHVEAQRLQKSAKLREARAALVRCSDPSCPAVLVKDCTDLFGELDRAVPSLVFVVRDKTGRDVANARVFDGDALLLERLDGKAVEIDPGEHRFRVEAPGAPPVEQKLVVREGDKLRRVEVVVGAGKETPPPPSGERDVTPAFWVVGGIGVAGLALFGGLAGAGVAKKGALDDRGCAPACPTDDVDEVRSLFIGADVSLAIGLAGLAVAPILYFTSPESAAPAAAWVVPVFGDRTAGVAARGSF